MRHAPWFTRHMRRASPCGANRISGEGLRFAPTVRCPCGASLTAPFSSSLKTYPASHRVFWRASLWPTRLRWSPPRSERAPSLAHPRPHGARQRENWTASQKQSRREGQSSSGRPSAGVDHTSRLLSNQSVWIATFIETPFAIARRVPRGAREEDNRGAMRKWLISALRRAFRCRAVQELRLFREDTDGEQVCRFFPHCVQNAC